MPKPPNRTAARGHRRLLHDDLAALATMDEATRAAYLSQSQEWDAASLEEPPTGAVPPLAAEELLARWRSLPTVDPERFRADVDGLDSER